VTRVHVILLVLTLFAGGCPAGKALAHGLRAKPGTEAEFRAWLAERPARLGELERFEAFLAKRGVADVVPAWQLWRQGSDWRSAGEPAFLNPPRARWGEMVPTLRVLRDEVIPRVGPVEVWSAQRSPEFNRKAGGAKSSAHLKFRAVDVVPARCDDMPAMHRKLYRYWQGPRAKRDRVGIGFYDSPQCRVHVDTGVRHRRWGRYPG
jgi:hypothetical protein